jgi:hypothetical protein
VPVSTRQWRRSDALRRIPATDLNNDIICPAGGQSIRQKSAIRATETDST